MCDEFRDLYKWVYYSSKFLTYCAYPCSLNNSVIEQFSKFEGIQEPGNFKTINQGSVLMILYGLFVLPKEFWENHLDKSNFFSESGFVFNSKGTFTMYRPNNDIDNVQFLRKLRNSIAHSNVNIDKDTGYIRFKNFNKNRDCDFEVTNNIPGLAKFVEEISGFFIDENNII